MNIYLADGSCPQGHPDSALKNPYTVNPDGSVTRDQQAAVVVARPVVADPVALSAPIAQNDEATARPAHVPPQERAPASQSVPSADSGNVLVGFFDWLLGESQIGWAKTAFLSLAFAIPLLMIPTVLDTASDGGKYVAIALGYPFLWVCRTIYWAQRKKHLARLRAEGDPTAEAKVEAILRWRPRLWAEFHGQGLLSQADVHRALGETAPGARWQVECFGGDPDVNVWFVALHREARSHMPPLSIGQAAIMASDIFYNLHDLRSKAKMLDIWIEADNGQWAGIGTQSDQVEISDSIPACFT